MFLGHFALGMAAKKVRPAVSLATLLVAAQFLDLLWPTFLVFGLEHVDINPSGNIPLVFTDYPISHGLFFVLVWALIFGVVYYLIRKDSKPALLLAALVASHWFLDLIVHTPDLPILPGHEARAGLGLWNHKGPTVAFELSFFLAGIFYYRRARQVAGESVSTWFWILVVILLMAQASDLFGPPPASADAVGWLAHIQWIFILFAWLAERKRNKPMDLASAAT